MVRVDAVETVATPGTYQSLEPLVDSSLGNVYTKRLIQGMRYPHVWQALQDDTRIEEGDLVVQLRIGIKGVETTHFFAIDSHENTILLQSSRINTRLYPRVEVEQAEPLSLDEILKEISTARKIQPGLKPRWTPTGAR